MNMNKDQETGKANDVDASDDTLGENTEQTPLAKEVEKDRREQESQNESQGKD